MSGVVNPVCRPSGPLGFYFASATGAFDPGRGCTSPPGLEPIDPAEDVPALRAWNQSTRQDTYVAKFAKSCSVDRRGASTQIKDRTRDDRDRTPSTIAKAAELVSLGIQSTVEISDRLSPVESGRSKCVEGAIQTARAGAGVDYEKTPSPRKGRGVFKEKM